MKRYLVLYLIILIVSSCSNSKHADIDYQRVIAHEIIPINYVGLMMRIKVDSDNRLLYLVKNDGSEHVKVYDLDNFEEINSFIKNGEGPNEQLIAYTLQLVSKNQMVYSTDPIKKRLFAYSLDSIKSGKRSFWPSYDIDLRNIGPEKILLIDDSLMIDFRKSYTSEDSYAYNLIDFNGQIVDTVGQYPKTKTKITQSQKPDAFVGNLNVSEKGKFIVRSYLFSDRLEKLDFNGNVMTSYTSPLQIEPQFSSNELGGGSSSTVPIKGSLIGFTGQAIIGENDIYILFDGKEFYRDDEESNLLFHFDTDLNLKEIIYLDQSIISFDIDWINRILIGFSWNVEGALIKYQLE